MQVPQQTIPAIILRLQTLRDSLSKAEKKVADYIINSPDQVIYLSVAELAQNSGVSDPTVVRTCQKIGLSGYQELKVTLAQDIVSPLQSIHEEILEDDSIKTVIDKVFQSTIHALTIPAIFCGTRAWKPLPRRLWKPTRSLFLVWVIPHAIAVDLQHKLMRLGCNATAYTDPHMAAIAGGLCGGRGCGFCHQPLGQFKRYR